MQDYGTEFTQKIEQAKVELAELSQKIYTTQDVAVILAALGTKLELFFKSVLFPQESPWRPFKHFVNCMEGALTEKELAELHSFREIYNLARHNPRLAIGVLELQEVIIRIEKIINKIVAMDLGRTSEIVSSSTRRMYWVAAWGHFDDAEVHIIVPSDEDVGLGPAELDMIHLEGGDWEKAKHMLATSGRLDGARGHVPEELIESWERSRDFVEAVCFEGEYRELLTSLARFESRTNRLPGTNRADCSQCVLVACLVAFVDVLSSIESPSDVVTQVSRQIVSNYAMTSSAVDLKEITLELANVAEALWATGEATQLSGPLWATDEEFEELQGNSIIASEKYPFIVDDSHRLIALHS